MSSIIVSRLPSAPIAACLAIMVFFSCVDQAPAGELREIYEGKAANERGDHEAAHEHFHEAAESATGERGAQLHLASGASASKAKLWGSAVSSYSQALLANNTEIKQDAHYGLANSLFYLGSSHEDQAERQKAWVGAVKHYEESLKIEPTKEAEENLSFVKSLLKKDQSEEQEDKEESEEKDDKEESSDEEESKKDDQEDSEKGKDDPTDQEDKTKEEQSDDPKEGGEPKPEDGDPKDGEDDPKKEEGKEGQPDESEKKDGEGESDPQESEESESDQEKGEEDEMANLQQEEKPPKEETAEERARRILNQQADFGKRPPSSQRRVLRRPKKDW
jgi:Ca-activated chloride channel family protein